MIELQNLRRDLGNRILFDEVSLRIVPGDKLGVVGPNGAGKSTLFRMILGEDKPDNGEVLIGKGTKIGYLPQEVAELGDRSVIDVVLDGAVEFRETETALKKLQADMEAAGGSPSEQQLKRMGSLQERFEIIGGYDMEARARRTLAGLGLGDEECERSTSSFSGGWIMRIALAQILIGGPDLILLDEPTNHLDMPSLEWFEGFLQAFEGAVVMVSHDRTFLDRIVGSILELDHGTATRYTGNYSRYVKLKVERDEQLERDIAAQERKIAETKRFIERFRAKNTKAKQVQSRVKMLEKMQKMEMKAPSRTVRQFSFPEPVRTGDKVVQMTELDAGYGEHVVLNKLDLLVRRGNRVALVGPNGAGKTTLLKVIAGELEPFHGECTLGANVSTFYFGQHQVQELDLKKRVLDIGMDAAPDAAQTTVRSALGSFLFRGEDVDKKVAVLSGGEKTRLALARMLLKPAPFLVLDEPTNHLDMESRQALENALDQFKGTLVIVSHDRAFVNKLATTIVEVTPGKVDRYEGNYDSYLQQRESQGLSSVAGPEKMSDGSALRNVRGPQEQSPSDGLSAKERRRQAAQKRKALAEKLKPLKQENQKLEAKIADAEERIKDIDTLLIDPDYYRSEAAGGMMKERGILGSKLERMTAKWMELQEKIDAIESESD